MPKTIKVYTPAELKKRYPDAFERAYNHFRDQETEIPWSDEIIDSLKGIIKASGLTLRDWSIGAYSPSYIRVNLGDAKDLYGPRAMAWLENNLFGALRERRTFSNRVKKSKKGE